MEKAWHPTPVLLPGKSHGRRSLVGCSPWGCWESDTTERLHFHFSLSCIGEGNGNPFMLYIQKKKFHLKLYTARKLSKMERFLHQNQIKNYQSLRNCPYIHQKLIFHMICEFVYFKVQSSESIQLLHFYVYVWLFFTQVMFVKFSHALV